MANSVGGRITFSQSGLDEINAGLARVAQNSQHMGNQVRAALIAATSGAQQFAGAQQQVAVSAAASRYAVTNLTFQINDVATSLASGISPFRTFAQQIGQFIQLFQQGGGVGKVLGDFKDRLVGASLGIAGAITPLRALGAAGVTAATGFGLLLARAENAEVAAQKFDVQLKALGKSGLATGKELEQAAHNVQNVGISVGEARKQISTFLAAGGQPQLAETVLRAGANLNAVLGEGSLERFVQAAGEGGEALKGIARQLGIVTDNVDPANRAFRDFTEENKKLNFEIQDAYIKRNRAIVDNERRTSQQIRDLTRIRGTEISFPGQADPTERREILIQAGRQEAEIRRRTQEEISDMLRLEARRRNEENQKALKEYNDAVLKASQEAADKYSLILQINDRVSGALEKSLGPLGSAMLRLSTAWNEFLDSLTRSEAVQKTLVSLGEFIKFVARLQSETGIPGIIAGITALSLVVVPLIRSLTLMVGLLSTESLPILIPLALLSAALLVATGNADLLYNALARLGIGSGAAPTQPAANQTPLDPRDLEYIQRQQESGAYSGLANQPASPFEVIRRAAGGLITGPGSGMSDSILARVSNGEYVVNAAATSMNRPLLDAINSMNRPIISRSGYAAGGLISSSVSGGRETFSITIEGKSFNGVSAPMNVARDLRDYARISSIMSAGKSPSWKG